MVCMDDVGMDAVLKKRGIGWSGWVMGLGQGGGNGTTSAQVIDSRNENLTIPGMQRIFIAQGKDKFAGIVVFSPWGLAVGEKGGA